MNNKDKCVNSLDKLYQEASFGSLEKAKLIGHYQTVFKRITQPTLDDAIAVVEEIIDRNRYKLKLETNQNERLYYSRRYYSRRLNAYEDILTALKGLKEGK